MKYNQLCLDRFVMLLILLLMEKDRWLLIDFFDGFFRFLEMRLRLFVPFAWLC